MLAVSTSLPHTTITRQYGLALTKRYYTMANATAKATTTKTTTAKQGQKAKPAAQPVPVRQYPAMPKGYTCHGHAVGVPAPQAFMHTPANLPYSEQGVPRYPNAQQLVIVPVLQPNLSAQYAQACSVVQQAFKVAGGTPCNAKGQGGKPVTYGELLAHVEYIRGGKSAARRAIRVFGLCWQPVQSA